MLGKRGITTFLSFWNISDPRQHDANELDGAGRTVAQIANLLFRRLPTCSAYDLLSAFDRTHGRPMGNRRNSRFDNLRCHPRLTQFWPFIGRLLIGRRRQKEKRSRTSIDPRTQQLTTDNEQLTIPQFLLS